MKACHPPSLQPLLPLCSQAVGHGQSEGCLSSQADLPSSAIGTFYLSALGVCKDEE